MKIAIYGRKFNDSAIPYVQQLIDLLNKEQVEVVIYEAFQVYLQARIRFDKPVGAFTRHEELVGQVDYLLSVGGDGTLLDTVALVRDSGIPVVGINLGRLGFLASIAKEEIATAVESLLKGHYTLDRRSLIRVESDHELFGGVNYGLNEITIHKKDTSSMIIIHTYLNGEFLNSYWADGLIVATPTGSTGYSLSCGGPIIFPSSENFVITPISPHNLNVRPIIISDNQVITFEVEGRSSFFLATLDSRTETLESSTQLAVRKENFQINLIRLSNENYLTTLRNKLMWGLDTRN
jgi:NAD+ kinase